MENDLKIYDANEVAEILKVNRMTVIRYIRMGRIEAFKVGNDWRITLQSLKKFIDDNTNKNKYN